MNATTNATVNMDVAAVIQSAATSALGIIALLCILLAVMGFGLFRGSSDRYKLAVFGLAFVGATLLAAALLGGSQGQVNQKNSTTLATDAPLPTSPTTKPQSADVPALTKKPAPESTSPTTKPLSADVPAVTTKRAPKPVSTPTKPSSADVPALTKKPVPESTSPTTKPLSADVPAVTKRAPKPASTPTKPPSADIPAATKKSAIETSRQTKRPSADVPAVTNHAGSQHIRPTPSALAQNPKSDGSSPIPDVVHTTNIDVNICDKYRSIGKAKWSKRYLGYVTHPSYYVTVEVIKTNFEGLVEKRLKNWQKRFPNFDFEMMLVFLDGDREWPGETVPFGIAIAKGLTIAEAREIKDFSRKCDISNNAQIYLQKP